MKIGLITFHHSSNYGAVLQSYATCRALKELGHEVEFINVQQLEKKKIRHVAFIPKYLSFNHFMKKYYPSETAYISDIDELRSKCFDYDCIMVGSDQVWNPNISLDMCMAYFLDFGNNSVRRVSYASSFGVSEWPIEKKNLLESVSKALLRFNHLSVREFTGQQLLLSQFGLQSEVVVDPTMLHSDYKEITGCVKNNGHIICYLLNRTSDQYKASRFVSSKLNIPMKLITNIYPICGFKYVYPPSIEKWIKYIGGAKFVITDSFHGLVFSLLYKRNFVVYAVENGRNSRLKDLLKLVGLEHLYFTNLKTLQESNVFSQEIDYDKVDAIIKQKRKDSWDFLLQSLS